MGTAKLSALLKRAVAPGLLGRAPQAPPPATNSGQMLARTFTNAAGTREYKLYLPATRGTKARPLVVMLHGCTQQPDDFAAGTRMNALAAQQGFLVAWPAQSTGANGMKCWNWFSPANQVRDKGEPALISGITREVAEEFSVDPARIVIAGLSAGAAMAVILGAAYPELYAGVGVHSGLPLGAAHSAISAMTAMRGAGNDATPPPPEAGTASPMRTIVFHGEEDATVALLNGLQVVDQAVARAETTLGPLEKVVTARRAANGREFTVTKYRDAHSATTIVEYWLVHGAGHAWSGGASAGSHTDASGPDASAEIIRFLLGK